MDTALLALAFGAGVAIFFSPCGVALLPSYIGLLIGASEKEAIPLRKRLTKGFVIGAVVSSGLLTVFYGAGLLVSLLGNFLAPIAVWIGVITGVLLVILGALMFFGKGINVQIPHSFQNRKGWFGLYLFGVGYALGGIGCTLPAFLFIVFASVGLDSISAGILNFSFFGFGAVLMMMLITLAASISKAVVQKWLSKRMGLIQKASSVVIVLGGIYLILFQLRALAII